MKEILFEPLKSAGPPRFAIASYGKWGSGKTRLGATMFGKIGVVPLERKTRPTLLKVAAEIGLTNGKIVLPKNDFIRHEKPIAVASMKFEESLKFYNEHRLRLLEAIYTLAERIDIDSIFIDSGTQLHEDICFAHCGRAQQLDPKTQRGPINQDWKDILNTIQHKHLLISHHARQIWVNNKPTSDYEQSGYNAMGYGVNAIVEQRFDDRNGEFELYVRHCQNRPDLAIATEPLLTGELITFYQLAVNIDPDTEWKEE